MRKVIAIISIFSAVSACNAAPPTADSIDALLVATKSESLIESVYANMEQMMRQGMAQAVSGKSVSAEQQRVLDAAPKQFAAVMREELSWSKSRMPAMIERMRAAREKALADAKLAK